MVWTQNPYLKKKKLTKTQDRREKGRCWVEPQAPLDTVGLQECSWGTRTRACHCMDGTLRPGSTAAPGHSRGNGVGVQGEGRRELGREGEGNEDSTARSCSHWIHARPWASTPWASPLGCSPQQNGSLGAPGLLSCLQGASAAATAGGHWLPLVVTQLSEEMHRGGGMSGCSHQGLGSSDHPLGSLLDRFVAWAQHVSGKYPREEGGRSHPLRA